MRALIALFYFLFSTFLLFSQEEYIPTDTLPFFHLEADTFAFSSDTSNLINFFHKFDSVIENRNGKINILHLGSSHVQAGVFSHRVRLNLLHAYPNAVAGRGFIFPYSVVDRSNNPIDYKVSNEGNFSLVRNVYDTFDKPLGVSGIAVYSSDTFAKIKIEMRYKDSLFSTNRIILIGKADSGIVEPLIVLDSVTYAPIETDTSTNLFLYEVPTFVDSFSLQWKLDSGNCFTVNGLLLENDNPGITFHSIGVNGARVSSYLKCTNFERDLRLINPDLVIMGIGVNDALSDRFDTLQFEREYLLLIEVIKSVNPDCAFIFITNNDHYKRIARGKYAVNTNGEEVCRVFYRLAAKTGGAVWDQYAIMGGKRSMYKWQQEKLAKKDKIHFTNKGYNLLGNLFFNAWVEAHQKVRNLNKNEESNIE